MNNDSKHTENIKTALKYAALGWSVIPVRPHTDPHKDDPEGKQKIPYIKWEPHQKRRATEKEIRKWFKRWPQANIGIVTGKISNLIVIDIDSYEALEHFRFVYGLPETIVQTTGREGGGWHFFFKHPEGVEIRSAGGVLPGVDVRGEGGIVVVPPSVHKSGRKYRWGM